MDLKGIAADTLRILKAGSYQTPGGQHVDLAVDLLNCVANTRCYEPDALSAIEEQVLARPVPFPTMTLEVTNETTLHAAARLAFSNASAKVGALNFASAIRPGGGFLSGAQAQEESLARSSGLYPSLLRCPSYYEHHHAHRTGLYSDRMIYSPRCPVFRTDAGTLLEQAYLVDFITSPAPNAGAVQRNEPHNLPCIEGVLRERSAKVLSLAVHNGCDVLILGAWGCGVFRNKPAMVADVFWEHLAPNRPFWGRFRSVLFAVLDTSASQGIYKAFVERFV